MAATATERATAAQQLRQFWIDHVATRPEEFDQPAAVGAASRLVLRAAAPVALPGDGQTWQRFEILAAIGSLNLSVARLVEAHHDAVAILAELNADILPDSGDLWGVWAAEPPGERLRAELVGGGAWRVTGRKPWCSGAGLCSHALVTADTADGSRLFAVDLDTTAVRPTRSEWAADALIGSDTRSVDFDGASASPIGSPGQYVERPGFWHGASGVAAVWYGGALGVGRRLLAAGRRADIGDLGRAHLGAVAASLTAARAVLHEAAAAIDADPRDAVGEVAAQARCVRAVVEEAALDVIDRVARALGPGPLATETEHLRRVADLTVYLRQSHAERDLADLGNRVILSEEIW
jgi:alkylation response protein AidB-like acyl-CoA dehydrogenase